MEKEWILRALCLLAVWTTGSLTSGKDIKTSLDANKTPPKCHAIAEGNEVLREENVKMGTDVILQCNDSKITWQEMFYVIWSINLPGKNCCITAAENDTEYDTCKDGKKLERDKHGEYYLTIPNFSIKDEGNYTCDVSYRAGGYITRINVTSWAHPHLSSWLEYEQGRTVAVCEAKAGKPEFSIHWETAWNSSSNSTKSLKTENGFFTARSRLPLPQNISLINLECVASVSSPNRAEIRIRPSGHFVRNPVKWPFILLAVFTICTTVGLLSFFYAMRERLLHLSIFTKVCYESKSSGPIEEKLPQPRDPEEVEPYASYVQRVNSIYNSSAELFNA